MTHANMTVYNKYLWLLFTARYTHQSCVRAVPPEDGQVVPETCQGFEFNTRKLKVIVKCIKLVRVIKL
jgi:hypothetical protein